jgi:hypothetical protein
MKNLKFIITCGVIFVSLVVVFSSCKKKSTDTTPSAPTFIMSSTADPAIANNVFFYFKCTTNDVKLTKVVVSDPIGAINDTYDLQSANALENVIYQLSTSYQKETGTWKFVFTGNRVTDNSAFTSTTTLLLSK